MTRSAGPARIALGVFLLAAAALVLTRHHTPDPLPPATAIRAARADPLIHRFLRGAHVDQARAEPVDSAAERVTFLSGGRVVAEAEVDRRGVVSHPVDFRTMQVPYGNRLAYQPPLLAGLAGLFVLMTAVAPLRRLRNLDVAAALSLVAPMLVLEARYQAASVLAALPGLSYLLARCLRAALGPPRTPAPSVPLWSLAVARLVPAARIRLLRWLAALLALTFVMVGVSSSSPVDVIFAVMEGATRIVHGVLPYGHMPGDVVHGDTYPILSYLLYVPLAAIAPVSSNWDSVDPALAVGVLAALLTAAALARAVGRRAGAEAGLRAAVACLAFPPLLVTASTGTTDLVLAAMLVLAVLVWHRPARATAVLCAAAWFKLAPAALVPLAWAGLRGRSLARATLAGVAVSIPLLVLVVALGGPAGVLEMAHGMAFQFSRGSPQSTWNALGLSALQPLGAAAVLALVAGAAARLGRDARLAEDPRRVAALAAAVLIGLELAAGYWAFLYLAWVMPLVCLGLLGDPAEVGEPLAERRPLSGELAWTAGG